MARGGRNVSTEEDRMKSMETNVYMPGRKGSGPVNFEKPAYDRAKTAKSPKMARKP